jgi:hypothetical protein
MPGLTEFVAYKASIRRHTAQRNATLVGRAGNAAKDQIAIAAYRVRDAHASCVLGLGLP